jgi:hypothetical protein
MCCSCWFLALPAAAQTPAADVGVEAALQVGYALRAFAADDRLHGASAGLTVDSAPISGGFGGRLGLDVLAFPATGTTGPRLTPLLVPALTWRVVEGAQAITAAFGPAVGVVVDARVFPTFGAKAALQTRFLVVDGLNVTATVAALGLVGDSVVATASLGLAVDLEALWKRAQRGEDTTDIAVEVAPGLAPVLHGL